jgi:ornithine cyclodeaminase/alanine dehydrogenase-like protein (mu-crystallin family)
MTLVLTNEDAENVLTMRGTIDALQVLYDDLGRGSAVYRGRTDLFTPTAGGSDEAPSAYQLKTLDGAIPRWNVGSIRVTSDVVAFPVVGGQRRRIKIPAAEGKRYVGLVFLFDSATGQLAAILQDGLLQQYSVGAINAIGAKYLSREDSATVALFGAGAQAGPQIRGLLEVRPIRRIRVYTPTPGEAGEFARANERQFGVEIVAASSPEDALSGADVVVTATNSRVPFFPASWLKPGMHLSCLQRDEAMPDCFRELDCVIFHTRAKEVEQASTDFAAMERRFGFTMHDHPPSDLDWNSFPDLGDLVCGRVPGRSSAQQRTFFLNSTGCGAQYAAVAQLILKEARQRGLGRELPDEWFTQATSG